MRAAVTTFVMLATLGMTQAWSEHALHPTAVTGLCADATPGRLLLLENIGRLRTWTIDGDRFLSRADVDGPPVRDDFALVHDTRRRRVLLVAGVLGVNSFLSDTWSWDGVRWTQLPGSAPARSQHAMAYDAARDRVVLHGGMAQLLPAPWGPSIVATTHEFDGTTWRPIATNGPLRSGHAMAWDANTARTVLTLGQDSGVNTPRTDAWDFDGITWRQLPTTAPTLWPVGAVYEPTTARFVVHGNVPPTTFPPVFGSETWEFDGSTWTRRATSSQTDGALALDTGSGTAAWVTDDVPPGPGAQVMRLEQSAGAWNARPRPQLPLLYSTPITCSLATLETIAWTDLFSPAGTRTWVHDGIAWHDRTPLLSPPQRLGVAFAEAFGHGHVLLFGGQGQNGTLLGDTWLWDGTTWTSVAPANAPSPREGPAACAIYGRQSVLLFGGYDGSVLGDTWEWNGVTWSQLATSGPPGRSYGAIVHDPVRQRTVLHSGYDLQTQLTDTWEWNGAVWQQRATSGPLVTFPRLVQDLDRRRTLLHGRNAQASTWAWTGTVWQPLATGMAGVPVFDFRRNQVVLYARHDLAVLTTTPAASAAVGRPCAGTPGNPELVVFGSPIVESAGLALGVVNARPQSPLLLFLDVTTQPVTLPGGCTVQLPNPLLAHWQLTDAGGAATMPFPLRGTRSWLGRDLFVQAAVLDSAGALGGLLALTQARRLQLGH